VGLTYDTLFLKIIFLALFLGKTRILYDLPERLKSKRVSIIPQVPKKYTTDEFFLDICSTAGGSGYLFRNLFGNTNTNFFFLITKIKKRQKDFSRKLYLFVYVYWFFWHTISQFLNLNSGIFQILFYLANYAKNWTFRQFFYIFNSFFLNNLLSLFYSVARNIFQKLIRNFPSSSMEADSGCESIWASIHAAVIFSGKSGDGVQLKFFIF